MDFPIVTAELNHLSTHLVLDTAASVAHRLCAANAGHGLAGEGNRRPAVEQQDGRVRAKTSPVGSLTLGQMELRGQPAFLVQKPWDRNEDFDGLMSPALLGITRLAIDAQRGVVEFSR